MHPDKVAALISAALPGAEVLVRSDDQTHFDARVVAEEDRLADAREAEIGRAHV